MKFKVGDEVRIIKCSACKGCVGKTITISEVKGFTEDYAEYFSNSIKTNHDNFWRDNELKLIKGGEKKMAKRGRPAKKKVELKPVEFIAIYRDNAPYSFMMGTEYKEFSSSDDLKKWVADKGSDARNLRVFEVLNELNVKTNVDLVLK